jgi:hypothetical protein
MPIRTSSALSITYHRTVQLLLLNALKTMRQHRNVPLT